MTNNERSVGFFMNWFGFFAFTNITIDKVFNEACENIHNDIYVKLRKLFMKDFGY